jgi:hypothetical protein
MGFLGKAGAWLVKSFFFHVCKGEIMGQSPLVTVDADNLSRDSAFLSNGVVLCGSPKCTRF